MKLLFWIVGVAGFAISLFVLFQPISTYRKIGPITGSAVSWEQVVSPASAHHLLIQSHSRSPLLTSGTVLIECGSLKLSRFFTTNSVVSCNWKFGNEAAGSNYVIYLLDQSGSRADVFPSPAPNHTCKLTMKFDSTLPYGPHVLYYSAVMPRWRSLF